MEDPVAELDKARKALAREESALLETQQELERVQQQRHVLEEEVVQQRKAMHNQWYENAKKRFADFDVEGALLGNPTPHEMRIGTAVYHLLPPTQQRIHDVLRWAEKHPGKGNIPAGLTPGEVPDPEDDYGPVSDNELMLMQWLHSVGAVGEERMQDIAGLPPVTRVILIRRMLPAIVAALADACMDLQGYLNLAVGHELGNF